MRMKNGKLILVYLWTFTLLLLAVNFSLAQDNALATVEKLMVWQIDAWQSEDLERYTKHGTKAFKQHAEEFTMSVFTSLAQGRIAKGYRLEYLGAIKRTDGHTYLWRVHANEYKYEMLGKLGLTADGKVSEFLID
jgi:hypothetical protein